MTVGPAGIEGLPTRAGGAPAPSPPFDCLSGLVGDVSDVLVPAFLAICMNRSRVNLCLALLVPGGVGVRPAGAGDATLGAAAVVASGTGEATPGVGTSVVGASGAGAAGVGVSCAGSVAVGALAEGIVVGTLAEVAAVDSLAGGGAVLGPGAGSL